MAELTRVQARALDVLADRLTAPDTLSWIAQAKRTDALAEVIESLLMEAGVDIRPMYPELVEGVEREYDRAG